MSVSPALSDKAKFPLFARVTAPDTQTNPVRLLLLQTFGWRRVATIHQSYDLFAAVSTTHSPTAFVILIRRLRGIKEDRKWLMERLKKERLKHDSE